MEPGTQQWLFRYANPLTDRVGGSAFFRTIPKTPGVYRMLDGEGRTLYVGKAKVLRARLNSYRHLRPGAVSRKIIRMIHQVREIRWEECASEMNALLRENQLLRELTPPFNTLNTRHHTYSFIGLRIIPLQDRCLIRLRLTTNPSRKGDLLFGAYRGRGKAQQGYAALLRLVWAMQNSPARFEYPARLTRRSPPGLYSLEFPPEWVPVLKRFMRGQSDLLLGLITCRLLENEAIPPFFHHLIQEDLDALQSFYRFGPRRCFELKRNHGVRTQLIAQDRIDDLLVMEQARLGKVDRGTAPATPDEVIPEKIPSPEN